METVKQNNKSGDSSIAWFKLSQLVSRGEKEKAHGLYKLLSYSLDDKAFALQVEADLLWAFDDQEAVEKYKQAAFLYTKEQKIISAAGIYEHLLILDPDAYDIIELLIECYAKLDWFNKVQETCDNLIELGEGGKVPKEQVYRILKMTGENYKFDDKKKTLKLFITYLKSKTSEIAALARGL